MRQGVGVDNATALADIAGQLGDILDAETSNVTEGTWQTAFSVVDALTDIRTRYRDTPVHADELKVSKTFRVIRRKSNNNNYYYY